MADYAIPKSGVAYVLYTGLVSQADTKLLKSAPTLAAGDFKVSIDGGAFANLATLPTNTPGGTSVKISLSAGEMTGDNILVACIDAAGAEWCDQIVSIQTSPVGLNNLATPTNITAGTITTAGSVTTAITLPTIPTNWITADGIATDAIGSAEVSAAAVTKIQTGVATSAAVGAIQTDVTTLLGRITSTLFSGITSLKNWLGSLAGKTADAGTLAEINATTAGATFTGTTDSLQAIRDQGDAAWLTGSSGGGTGARLVTVTVNDGASALENAIVRMTLGAESYSLTTNVSGVAVFSLDDGTWTVTATKPGYTLTPTTIVVNGTETATYSMTAVSVTPSDPDQTTGTITVYTAGHVAVSGAVVDVEILRLENGTTGSGISDPLVSDTTNGSGYAEFTGLPRLASYRVRINDGKWFRGVTLDAAETPLVGSLGPAVDD